jgi:hypothetical protein
MNRSIPIWPRARQQAPHENHANCWRVKGELARLPPKLGSTHPGGRISSINRLFAASNGLTNLTRRP